MCCFVRRCLAVVTFAVVVLIALVAQPRLAGAQESSEQIHAYLVAMGIAEDGTLSVLETIRYNFGTNERHGIQRDLVRRESYDSDHDRLYEIDVTGVSTSEGTPDDFEVIEDGPFVRVRIGDPDTTITGEHIYSIAYTVKGALQAFPDHDELNWDVVGNEWAVPVNGVVVTVGAPATIEQVACYSGPPGSQAGCDRAASTGSTAGFGNANLSAGSGMTTVVALPKGAIVPEPEVILDEHRTLGDAFAVRPLTVGTSGVLAVLGIGAVGVFAYRRGRDRRYVGSPVDAAMGNATGVEERVPLGERDAGPVEFVPPDDVRPGQVGTLVDEQANLLDVTATIVDMAVRGHLLISEIANGKRPDYELTRIDGGEGTLKSYERRLYAALFASSPTVKLSDLKYTFTAELAQVKTAMYDDAVDNGWYRFRPDRTRMWWRMLGLLVTLVGVGLTIVTAVFSSFGIIPLAVVVTGIALLVVGGRMPARTGKGSAMLSRVEGFRRLFDEGEEDTRQRFAERRGIFSDYLPYAIVFGCTDRWARAFQGLDAEQLGAARWYHGHDAFTAVALASAMGDFDTRAMGTLYASQPSSSSSSGFGGGGFSGGGGGGGGGSSW